MHITLNNSVSGIHSVYNSISFTFIIISRSLPLHLPTYYLLAKDHLNLLSFDCMLIMFMIIICKVIILPPIYLMSLHALSLFLGILSY